MSSRWLQVTYHILNVSSSASPSVVEFRIGHNSGRLTMRVAPAADAAKTVSGSGLEGNATLAVVVSARDDGRPSLSTTATLYVVVVNSGVVLEHDYWRTWSHSEAAGASSTHAKYRSVVLTCCT